MAETSPDRGAVLITGTSSGIGRETALLLASSGYLVFAGIRKEEDAQRLRADATGRLQPLILDICEPDHIAEAVSLVRREIGPRRGLTALVNNAGICEPGPLEYISMERFRKQMEINVTCHLAVIQAFLPMIRQETGRIINVTSAIARAPLPCFGAYVASKCAMEGLSDVLRRELSRWKIPVSIVEPGTVEAPLWDRTPDSPDKVPEGQSHPDLVALYSELNHQVYDVMQQGRRVAADPSALAKVIKTALESRRPRARYQHGPGSKMAVQGSRLPERITDWFIDKVIRKRLPTKFLGW
jgi:NAD(P)-dependent dehydrogenase (short-subunit alcohol dehydrogenase family)